MIQFNQNTKFKNLIISFISPKNYSNFKSTKEAYNFNTNNFNLNSFQNSNSSNTHNQEDEKQSIFYNERT